MFTVDNTGSDKIESGLGHRLDMVHLVTVDWIIVYMVMCIHVGLLCPGASSSRIEDICWLVHALYILYNLCGVYTGCLIMILTLVACCLEEAMLHPASSSFSCNGCYRVFWELHHKCHNVKNKTPSENLLHLKVQSYPQMPGSFLSVENSFCLTGLKYKIWHLKSCQKIVNCNLKVWY